MRGLLPHQHRDLHGRPRGLRVARTVHERLRGAPAGLRGGHHRKTPSAAANTTPTIRWVIRPRTARTPAPGGDGHCGTDNCPGYCAIIAKACNTEFATTFGGDTNTCLTECRKVKGSAGNSGFSTSAPNGNTLQCRLLHAIRAFDDPMGACPSAVGAVGSDCN